MTLSSNSISRLRQFMRPPPRVERCELCGREISREHQHLLEPANRRLVCSCDACTILFDTGENARYRRVPRQIQILSDFRLTDVQWESLHLPINLAFVYFSTAAKRVVAMYPSPAGATESLLTLESWEELSAENPVLRELAPDVEALLIHRIGEAREYCRVPIDECFKLVGLIRTHWRGLSGGTAVWEEIGRFFNELKQRSVPRGAPMPDLNFTVEKATAVPYAAAPVLNFALKISDTQGGVIHAVALRCQIRIEPLRRRYQSCEQEKLLDLFGQPSRWGQTLRPMLWTHAAVVVPPFDGSTTVDLPVPCTYDFNLAAAKYFYALEGGEVPLNLLFSGTIFHESEDGQLQVAQISWEKETNFRLPVTIWKEMMEIYYPNTAWLCLGKSAFDALYRFKSSRSLPTWEAAIERLLEDSQEKVGT